MFRVPHRFRAVGVEALDTSIMDSDPRLDRRSLSSIHSPFSLTFRHDASGARIFVSSLRVRVSTVYTRPLSSSTAESPRVGAEVEVWTVCMDSTAGVCIITDPTSCIDVVVGVRVAAGTV